MKLQIHAALKVRCAEFLQRQLEGFDTRMLEYVRLHDRTGHTKTRGVWGRCAFPNRRKQLGYRIRCCVSIAAQEFPHRVKWAIGTRKLDEGQWEWIWRKDRFSTMEEAFVWLVGHEAFHWLRHSRQIPGRNYETQANRCGFAWLDEWRALTVEDARGPLTGLLHTKAGKGDTAVARILHSDGRIDRFNDQHLACLLWLALPKGVRAAFRGANDARPVYPWDYADVL